MIIAISLLIWWLPLLGYRIINLMRFELYLRIFILVATFGLNLINFIDFRPIF